jgi:hypothetical protein
MVNVAGAQYQEYDLVPVSGGEYYDPFFNAINGFYTQQHEPYDLFTIRSYWSIKTGQPLPVPGDEGLHPNPTGSEGCWIMVDGFTAGNGFEGYQWMPPYTSNQSDYHIPRMEEGRAWHSLSQLPGGDGRLESTDDRVLICGGGDDVLAWGGQPVIPSAVVFVPPPPR